MQKIITDNYLVGIRKGDKKALDEVYHLYYKKLFNFSLAYLKDEQLAQDIVQETFLKLWENRTKLKGDTKPDALLFTISKNAILSLFRKHSTESKYLKYLESTQLSNSDATENLVNYNLLNDKYEALIKQLPPKRMEIFILSRKKGKSNNEIADKLGISEKTVKNQITQALAFFKENLSCIGLFGSLYYYLFIG